METVAEVLAVLHRIGRAPHVLQLVVVQVLAVDGAAVAGFQVAVLAVPQRAALVHDARRDGGIHVGGDVPVERLGEFEAALAGGAGSRGQQAALAFIVQREVQPGRVEDRRSQENQGGVARGAFFGIVVEAQIGGAHEPVRISPRNRRAGTVGGVGEAVLALALEIHAGGRPVSGGEFPRKLFFFARP